MNSILAKKLGILLQNKNITARDIEKRAGLTKSSVYNIIHGRSKNPSIELIAAISKQLNCSMEELISEDISISNLPRSNDEIKIELFTTVVDKISQEVKAKGYSVNLDKFVECCKEVYQYINSVESPDIEVEVDERFLAWICKKMFKKENIDLFAT